jgi:hypothetical protein
MLSHSNPVSVAGSSAAWPQYLLRYLLTLALVLVLVAGINLIVDPLARFGVVERPGFNQVKIALTTNSRKGKANALRQCDYDTLVLGASTAETGITQQHPVLGASKFYNAALRGGSMYELRRMVGYALQYQRLETVVLGLDFSTFSSSIVFLDDFADSPLAEEVSIGSLVRYLFSIETLKMSVATVRWNVSGNARAFFCTDNGQHKRTYELIEAREAFDFILRSYAEEQFSNYGAGDLHFQQLAAMLQELRAANVAVYAFISPAQVIHRELVTEIGLLDEYENWKRQLAQIFAAANGAEPDAPAAVLWDFSGYSPITTEAIPVKQSGKFMQWYSDPVHFEPKVGNLILDRMFGLPPASSESAVDFGVVLTPQNVEALLAKERRDSERYRREHPEELAHLQNLLPGDSGGTKSLAF